jgi:3-oxosteroid 1-dehydrogenase
VEINIKANKGVILASGGFEKDQSLRDEYLPKPTNIEWSAANTLQYRRCT